MRAHAQQRAAVPARGAKVGRPDGDGVALDEAQRRRLKVLRIHARASSRILVPRRLRNLGSRLLARQRAHVVVAAALVPGLGVVERGAEPVHPRKDARVHLCAKLRRRQRARDLEDEVEQPHGFNVGDAGPRRVQDPGAAVTH